jgi:hypothetical protein
VRSVRSSSSLSILSHRGPSTGHGRKRPLPEQEQVTIARGGLPVDGDRQALTTDSGFLHEHECPGKVAT